MGKLRLLFVAEAPPSRNVSTGNGSSLISAELLNRLPNEFEVELLVFSKSSTCEISNAGAISRIEILPVRAKRAALIRSLVTRSHPGTIERDSRRARIAVATRSQAADVTYLHGPYVLHLAKFCQSPVVAQVVDPTSVRLDVDAATAAMPLRAYLRFKARLARTIERQLSPQVRVLTVSPRDAETWRKTTGRAAKAIPCGVDLESPETSAIREQCGQKPRFGFVGSLRYGPNERAARRLLDEVTPRVLQRNPDAVVVVAGRNPPAALQARRSESVEILANVPSIADVLQSLSVAVFPDTEGAGTRNSVMEALLAGVPTVATPIAARNLPSLPHLMVTEDVDEMADLIASHLGQSDMREVHAAAAREALPDWDAVALEYAAVLRAAAGEAR